jgi:hypothetical protein
LRESFKDVINGDADDPGGDEGVIEISITDICSLLKLFCLKVLSTSPLLETSPPEPPATFEISASLPRRIIQEQQDRIESIPSRLYNIFIH